MMRAMTRDWARLGAALAAARDQAGLRQADVAERLDVGLSTVQGIERGTERKKVTPVIRSYARLVGWQYDAPDRVLVGDEPARREAAERDAVAALNIARGVEQAPGDLSARIRRAIADGSLIDSQVVTIPTEVGEITAAIVVRGQPDMSEEELARALLAWEERERRLREPDGGDATGADG